MKLKKLLALTLALCLLLALAACGSIATPGLKLEDLVGSWQSTYDLDEEEADEILEYFGFTEEEREIIDHNIFQLAQIFTVTTDKTYSFAIDGERSRSLLRQSFNNAIGQAYEHLGELEDTYGEGITDAITSLDEFKDYYAEIYECDSYDDYLNEVVDDFLTEYYDMSQPVVLESGTFTIDGSDLSMLVDGESESERLGVSLSGNTLLLTYADGEELYTRLAQ